ncbi:MAG: thioredoxin domain-containing protein [Leptolyngbyaceae cyanobacterium bins.349]|nr:thioredoxin domain-containing protein [Leptolyngbyaceae cyanobacterium bins.349]
MSSVKIITDAEFETEVLQSTQPVLVYFWAPWCGPCRLMAPIMDTVAAAYGDRLKVIKMEIDPNPEAVKAYKVDGVPAFRLFQAGEVLEVLEGAVPKQKIDELLSPHLAAV